MLLRALSVPRSLSPEGDDRLRLGLVVQGLHAAGRIGAAQEEEGGAVITIRILQLSSHKQRIRINATERSSTLTPTMQLSCQQFILTLRCFMLIAANAASSSDERQNTAADSLKAAHTDPPPRITSHSPISMR